MTRRYIRKERKVLLSRLARILLTMMIPGIVANQLELEVIMDDPNLDYDAKKAALERLCLNM